MQRHSQWNLKFDNDYQRLFMMNQNDGWMNGWGNGWMGGGTGIWTVVGILVVILLVVAISKLSKK